MSRLGEEVKREEQKDGENNGDAAQADEDDEEARAEASK